MVFVEGGRSWEPAIDASCVSFKNRPQRRVNRQAFGYLRIAFGGFWWRRNLKGAANFHGQFPRQVIPSVHDLSE